MRHGTTRANLEGRIQGGQDTLLCEQGVVEIGRLAQRLREHLFAAVYSSPLRRAVMTAEAVIQENIYRANLEPIRLSWLKEYGWGILEGFTWEELKEARPDFYEKIRHDFWETPVPGREAQETFLERISKTLELLISRHFSPERVLLVTHGRFINAFITFCLGLDLQGRWPFSPARASISILKTAGTPETTRLQLFNDTCHLI